MRGCDQSISEVVANDTVGELPGVSVRLKQEAPFHAFDAGCRLAALRGAAPAASLHFCGTTRLGNLSWAREGAL